MGRQSHSETRRRGRRPATSPEAREQELASYAYDLAEEQILNGTASSQVVTHFLKAGSRREELERVKIEHEIELAKVKAEQLEGQKRVEELYVNALEAMRGYSGRKGEDEEHEG